MRTTTMASCLGRLAAFSTLMAVASADVPRFIQYQGKLMLTSGAAVPGPIDLRVRLYDQAAGPANLLFDETHSAVGLTNGLFSILLGSQTPGGIPDTVFAVAEVYLGSSIDGDPEMTPRRRIVTTPYTLKAKSSEQLVRPDTVQPAVTVDSSGQVGVGTASPNEALTVNGGINLGNSSNANAGTIRWTGSDFEGYTGTEWVSLTISPPPELALTPESQSGMDVTGPGVPAYGSYVTFSATNTGGSSSGAISTSFLSGANFEIANDNCSGASLAVGEACTFDVRPVANEGLAGPISDTLQVSASPGGSDSAALSGNASGFSPAQLIITTPDQTNMNVAGAAQGTLAYGSPVTFTVANTGDFATGSISTSLQSGTNFEILSNNCSGMSLAGGSTCTLDVRPRASSNGSINDTLMVSATPGGSDSVSLAGTASGFTAPCSGWSYGGLCWYYATGMGQSCDAICSSHGGMYSGNWLSNMSDQFAVSSHFASQSSGNPCVWTNLFCAPANIDGGQERHSCYNTPPYHDNGSCTSSNAWRICACNN